MKTILTILIFVHCFPSVYGQYSNVTLQFNNVSARVTNAGTFFNNSAISTGAYEIPAGSSIKAFYTASFWFGGTTVQSGDLRLSATTWTPDKELFPGPYSITGNYDPTNNYIWSVTRNQILDHINNYDQQGYIIPAPIANWPGNGDLSKGEAFNLAPFIDMNNNNLYEPHLGEYPEIRGDKAVYMIMNDDEKTHTTGTDAIGIEVHLMFYQYASNDYLNNTTFINLRVFNRGVESYNDFTSSLFSDMDLGNYADDYFGSDESRNMIFSYNGDNYDENNSVFGYGQDPPSVGIVSLSSPLSSACTFSNSVNYPYSDPSSVAGYWNFMNGKWADGSNWYYGGYGYVGSPGVTNTPTSFIYSGDPNNIGEWSEFNLNNIPGDRRALLNIGPQVLGAGQSICQDFAIIYNRTTGNAVENVTGLKTIADDVQSFFNNQNFNCQQVTASKSEVKSLFANIRPNPSKGSFNIALGHVISGGKMTITNVSGRVVYTSNIDQTNNIKVVLTEPAGVYFVHITSDGGKMTEKIIIE